MRYLLAFLVIFISFSVNAQNRFPSVDSAKNYVLRYVKNSAVETFTNWRAQNVAYGTLELLDSLATDPKVDSIYIQLDTLKYSKGGTIYTVGKVGGGDTATVVKAYVTNAEAVTITKGQVVYIFGASGDRASVKLAKNTSDTFSSKTLGIVRADIAAGQAGWITTQGQVSGINLGAYSPGDVLWLDSVAGGFTATKPVAPYHSVFVGVVERANAGNGLIYVKPQNGQELGELHDTKITSPTNNQVLAYTAATDIWENKNVTTALGYTPLNVTDTTAMLSPYLRKVDTLSLSNRIANASGVQWSGIDSNYVERLSLNGFHEVDEPMLVSSTSNNPGALQGSKYRCEGLWNGAVENDINYINGSTSTSATGAARYNYGNGFVLYVPSANWVVYTTRIRIPTLNDGTQKFYVNLLFGSGLISPTIGEGVGFLYDLDGTTTGSSASANWQTYSVNNSTRTFNQNYTGVAVAANTWTKLKIIFNNTEAYYYIDGTLVARHTSNLPAGDNIFPNTAIIKTAGIVARTYQIDYSTIDIKYSTPR
jgi:hypothetical protein